jgi:hypothetical protein
MRYPYIEMLALGYSQTALCHVVGYHVSAGFRIYNKIE